MSLLIASFDNLTDFSKAIETLPPETRPLDFFSPHEIEFTERAQEKTRGDVVRFAALIGAIVGLVTALGMQIYSSVYDAPLAVGGRPLFSWPAFVPVTFVLTILFAGLFNLAALFWRLKLPWPHHPVFSAPQFDLSQPRYYLMFDLPTDERARRHLEAHLKSVGASHFDEVAP